MKNSTKRCNLSKSERIKIKNKTISFVILFVICFIWIIPLLYMLGMSFKTTPDIIANPTQLFPDFGKWTFENYAGFFQMKDGHIDDLPLWMINSIVSTLISVVLSIIITVLASYAFVFLRFKGSKLILTLITASMAIPSVITFVPLYTMYTTIGQSLGINSSIIYVYAWVIGPGLAGAFNLVLMVDAYKSIPKEIVESARSDGANEWKVFFKITTPLIKSTIIVCALFAFSGSWNALLWPQLILGSQDSINKTITVSLIGYISNQSIDYKGLAMATCVFSMLPTFIVYLFAQNKIIEGLASTGVKK